MLRVTCGAIGPFGVSAIFVSLSLRIGPEFRGRCVGVTAGSRTEVSEARVGCAGYSPTFSHCVGNPVSWVTVKAKARNIMEHITMLIYTVLNNEKCTMIPIMLVTGILSGIWMDPGLRMLV